MAIVVRMRLDGIDWYLRHSKGPLQGHFFDVYPDDYLRPELAELAIEMHLNPPRLKGSNSTASAVDESQMYGLPRGYEVHRGDRCGWWSVKLPDGTGTSASSLRGSRRLAALRCTNASTT